MSRPSRASVRVRASTPTKAELVQLRIDVVGLENMIIIAIAGTRLNPAGGWQMSIPSKSERSLLSYEDFETVRVTHHPAIYDFASTEAARAKSAPARAVEQIETLLCQAALGGGV